MFISFTLTIHGQINIKLEVIIWILEGCRWIVQWFTLIRLLSKNIIRTKFKVQKIIAKSYRTWLSNLWHAAFTTILIFISFARPASLYYEEHMYGYISDSLEIEYELSLLPNNTVSETFLNKSERCEMLTGYWAWRWLVEHVTVDRRFYTLIFKQEIAAAQVTSTFSSLSHSLWVN